MRILVSSDDMNKFILNLLMIESANTDSVSLQLQFIVNSNSLIKEINISNCLKNHFNFEYSKSYNQLYKVMKSDCLNLTLTHRLLRLLLNLEYLNTKLHLGNEANFSQDYFLKSNTQLLSAFGLRLKQFEFNDTKRIQSEVLSLLKEGKQFHVPYSDDITTSFMHLFSNYALVSNVFRTNQICITDMNSSENYNKTTSYSIDEKLNHIERDLNDIQFDHLINLALTEEECNKTYEEEKRDKDTDDCFLFKLRIFNKIKQYYKTKKTKKEGKTKLQEKEIVAVAFHKNLLRFRTFYGLQKLSKRHSYYQIIKTNYEDYRIIYLEKYFIKNLVYAYNRRKIIQSHHEYRDKAIKNKLFHLLVKKTKFRSDYNKVYLSQLMNSPYCVKFLIQVCEVALKDKIKFRERLIINFKRLRMINLINEKRKAFANFIEAYMLNQSTSSIVEAKVQEFRSYNQIREVKSFIYQIQQHITRKAKVDNFHRKLFLLRYYYIKYKSDYKVSLYQQIKVDFKNKVSLRSNFFCFMKNLTILKQKEVLAAKFKVYQSNRMYRNFIYLKNTLLMIRKVKLMSKRRPLMNFVRNIKINRIESLIVQAIIEKIKSFKRKELLTLMIMSSFNKIKTKHALYHNGINLKKKSLRVLSGKDNLNVTSSINNDPLLLKYHYRNFFKRILINLKSKDKLLHLSIYYDTKRLGLLSKFFFLKVLRQLKTKQLKLKQRLIRNKSINKDMKHFFMIMQSTTVRTRSQNNERKLVYRIFLIKSFKFLQLKQLKRTKLVKVFKQFSSCINKRIKDQALKLFTIKFVQMKAIKMFIKRVYKKLDFKYLQAKLYLISRKHYSKVIYSILDVSSKNRDLLLQINSYYNLKTKRKIFDRFKKNYIKNIKYHILTERFIQHISCSTLKFLANLKKNKLSI